MDGVNIEGNYSLKVIKYSNEKVSFCDENIEKRSKQQQHQNKRH